MPEPSLAPDLKPPSAAPTQVAAALFSRDAAAQWLGMQLGAVDTGCATVTLEIGPHMVNGHGSCHGGLIFALADTAFAIASNTANVMAVGSTCHIDYIRPVPAGDTLIATADECALAGRSGLYDIRIHNQDGQIVAVFHGRSQRLGAAVVTSEHSAT